MCFNKLILQNVGFAEPPEFALKLPVTKFVKKCQPLRLECKVKGSPSLRMQWYKNGTKITDGDNYRQSFVDSTAVLELRTTRFDDNGVYTCEATNDAGSISCSTTLRVKDAPSFLKVLRPIEGMKGKDASLHCEMFGTAPFEITWAKHKTPLKESRKYKIVNEDTAAALHIIGLEASDFGEYKYKASNSIGYEICCTTVQLRG
ncbi:titin-like [Oncorhynchus kisutch]|uniref:titin-like n=1 Tax=Oncorhynchus kisutch TaxID=8019 RepID=UPI0012DF3500|nr:titin-like [Oncorhynchus kisutch]